MVLDGIPESVAIGLTLLGGGNVSVALVGAVFLSNLPEAIGVAAALMAGRIPLARVLLRFAAIVAVGAVAAAVGYAVLNETDADAIAIIQSIAAGAMIVVVVNEMIPIAVRRSEAACRPCCRRGLRGGGVPRDPQRLTLCGGRNDRCRSRRCLGTPG